MKLGDDEEVEVLLDEEEVKVEEDEEETEGQWTKLLAGDKDFFSMFFYFLFDLICFCFPYLTPIPFLIFI